MTKYIVASFIFVCAVCLQSALFPSWKRLWRNFDILLSQILTGIWAAYHLYFIGLGTYYYYVDSKKLFMNSDEIKDYLHEKHSQFLMSWDQFRSIKQDFDSSVVDWEKNQNAIIENVTQRGGDITKVNNLDDQSNCIMNFGGKSGNVISFTSYKLNKDSSCKCCSNIIKYITCCYGCSKSDPELMRERQRSIIQI